MYSKKSGNVGSSKWSYIILISLLGALNSGAWALDLKQVYEASVVNDAQVRASRASADAVRERIPQANAQLMPNVALSAGRNYNDLTSTTPNILGQETTRQTHYFSGSQTLTVRQPLYRPYQLALLRQAEAQVGDAEATLQRDEQSLVVRAGEAYFEALLAEEQLKLIASQKSTYLTQLDAARKRVKAGSGTRTDIDEAQARLDLVVAQELEAKQNKDYTLHRIEVLTGQAVPSLAQLDVVRFVAKAPIPADLEAWMARAENGSPELQSLQSQIEIARQEIEKSKSGHLPTLDAVAQWSRTNSDSVTSVNYKYDNKMIGLQLSIPIFSGGYVSSTVRQAVASETRAREMLEATRRDLRVRVHREFRGVTEGVLKIAALEQAVRSAETALESNQRSFEAGIRTTLDVLNAEQQKTTALRDLAQARYLYLVSLMRLRSLAGDDRELNVSEANSWLMQ